MPNTQATFTAGDAAELAVVTRGGFIECRHIGSAVVLSPDGEILLSLGNPEGIILCRSALKPLQSLAMHEAGLSLRTDEERAISLASHTGAKIHTDLVTKMLENHKISVDALQTPQSYPADKERRYEMIRQGVEPSSLTHGCSGKHAAMLITCAKNKWNLDSYLNPEHPLQQQIIDTVKRFTGETPAAIVPDGCGAPTLGLSLIGLATGIRKMATASAQSPFPIIRNAAILLSAAKTHPELIEGPSAGDEIVMRNAGVFAKYGADGISVMAAPDGTTVAVKILDGAIKPARAVALALLTYVQAIPKETYLATIKQLDLGITGGGKKVGDIAVRIPALSN